MTLYELKPGQQAHIIKIHGEGPLRRRILDMGLLRGTRVAMIKRAPLGDPIELKLRGYTLSLRKSEAILIEVKK